MGKSEKPDEPLGPRDRGLEAPASNDTKAEDDPVLPQTVATKASLDLVFDREVNLKLDSTALYFAVLMDMHLAAEKASSAFCDLRSLRQHLEHLSHAAKFILKRLDPVCDPEYPLPSQEAREWIESLNVMIRDYRARVHDINNLLTVCIGYLGLPESDLSTVREYVNRILQITEEGLGTRQSGHQRLEQISKDLDQFGHFFGGRLRVELCLEDLPSEGYLPLLTNDFYRLVFDLLDNARNAGATEVSLSGGLANGRFCLRIKDNGPGFKGKDPLEASREKSAVGHGRGLPICFAFCERAGGSLKLIDQKAVGAEWLIELPLL